MVFMLQIKGDISNLPRNNDKLRQNYDETAPYNIFRRCMSQYNNPVTTPANTMVR